MAQVKKLLVVDADPETARLLAPPLRQRGYQVHAAHDGPRALQVAILRFPDLVLLDERTPLLDPRTFIRILRTNPRTERIPVVLMGLAAEPERARLGTWLQKPLQLAEVLARVEAAFRRADAAKAAGESQDLEGNLAQLPLPDLLQILSVNRKSGRLVVEREGERAEVVLREGRIVDASLGPVVAEKALWRLLTRREGQFTFTPGTPPGPDRIDRRLDDLLLEGLRQSDELAALLPESFSKRAFEAFDLSPVVCGHYWSGEITLGLNALDAVAPERLLTLRYEDLCADPKATLSHLGRFLEDELDPVWLEVAAARVGQGTSAWERLPAREAAELDEACRPGFEALAARGIQRERPR